MSGDLIINTLVAGVAVFLGMRLCAGLFLPESHWLNELLGSDDGDGCGGDGGGGD